MSDWLVSRGATHLVLASRPGVRTGYQSLMIHRWTDRDVAVSIDTSNLNTFKGAQNLIVAANKLAPVGGIFNLDLLKDQTEGDCKMASSPNIDVTKHLDAISRGLCPGLDHFICISSVPCGRDTAGQTNYGKAMERICEQRQIDGLPATSIQWGAIGDDGMIFDFDLDNNQAITDGTTFQQRKQSYLQTMDTFMQQKSHALLASMVLVERHNAGSSSDSLVNLVANILGIQDSQEVNDQSTLTNLGMDLLMEAEVKQILEQNYDMILNASEIRQLTFAKLKILLEK